ncbi:MAG TPA: dienelactone hydrolase family protein [Chthonomonadaceae bacterium]|nr:dienelactone hydrolase family protein [Chthonomonadaceae bacterium]
MPLSQPPGFLAVPAAGAGPGVLVLHAWWGLNDTIRAFCTQLADAGFVAFAPDLYRGKVTNSISAAEALVNALNADAARAASDLAAAVTFLSQRAGPPDRGLAVLGFSLGAYFALELANADPETIRSVVLYYGTGPDDFSASRAEFLGHFAEKDEFEPLESVDALDAALKRAGRPVRLYVYPGTGHWFAEPDRPDAYDPAAASLAWERTLAFLRQPAG